MNDRIFNVCDFGARADGVTKNTAAFAKAIKACSAAGGGIVLVEAGKYLTGPVTLQSNIELRTEKGTEIIFSRDYSDYPLVYSNYEGLDSVRCMSPLNARDEENVAITGQGHFDGGGDAWRKVKKSKLTEEQWADLIAGGGVIDKGGDVWSPTQGALDGPEHIRKLRAEGRDKDISAYEPVREFLRPVLLSFVNCRNVRIEGPTFENSPSWNLHPLMCDKITIRNVRVINPWWAQNGDGLDLDSCRNAVVADSWFDVGDDAICIKSGKDAEGRRRGRPCENINIVNCTVIHGHGGVTIGSEMSGGVRNITVSNCDFHTTDVGLRFKSRRGRGGTVENVRISNITMNNIKDEAISFDMYYGMASNGERPEAAAVDEGTPRFRNIHLSNITCEGAGQAMRVRGLPEMPVEALTLEHVNLRAKRGIDCSFARTIHLQDVRVAASEGLPFTADEVQGLTTIRFDACRGGTTTAVPMSRDTQRGNPAR